MSERNESLWLRGLACLVDDEVLEVVLEMVQFARARHRQRAANNIALANDMFLSFLPLRIALLNILSSLEI